MQHHAVEAFRSSWGVITEFARSSWGVMVAMVMAAKAVDMDTATLVFLLIALVLAIVGVLFVVYRALSRRGSAPTRTEPRPR